MILLLAVAGGLLAGFVRVVSSPKVRVKLVELVETNGLRQVQASLPLFFEEDTFIRLTFVGGSRFTEY